MFVMTMPKMVEEINTNKEQAAWTNESFLDALFNSRPKISVENKRRGRNAYRLSRSSNLYDLAKISMVALSAIRGIKIKYGILRKAVNIKSVSGCVKQK
jgi:hypothetical protein